MGESRYVTAIPCQLEERTFEETGIVWEQGVLEDEWLSIRIALLPAEEDGSSAARG
jgi:hypothetical protein